MGVTAQDPVTLIGAAAAMFVVAMTASFVPAWRLTRVDAMDALRSE